MAGQRVHRARDLITGYPELIAVMAAVVVGLTVQRPLAWLASHQAINVLLAVLVFAVAVTIEPRSLRRTVAAWPSLVTAIAAGIIVLPLLAWAVSRIVAPGPLRDGVLTVGVAPCEVASVATTSMAAGDAAAAAGLLIGSTLVTVAAASPILTWEAGRASAHTAHIIASLVLVVALPLAAGLALRASLPARASPGPAACTALTARVDRSANVIATVVVAALVAVIASQVHLSERYFLVLLALLMFLAASAALGLLLGVAASRPAAIAVLLGTSMRDFAIAAALAAAMFGPAAAAPLGLYGILVLAWGTAAAGLLRRRLESQAPGG